MTTSVSPLPPLPALLDRLASTPWLVVRGVPAVSDAEFLAWCRSAAPAGVDPLLHWGFGPLMNLAVDDDAKNYLFSREAVPFHWDGVFFQVPHVLVFHCLAAPPPGQGGETLFCDAERMYAELPPELRARWGDVSITYRTEKVAHYGGEATVPLFGTHPRKGTPVVRFAEAVATAKNPVTAQVNGLADERAAAELVAYFTRALYSPRYCGSHAWQVGDLVLADNHALMHGGAGSVRRRRATSAACRSADQARRERAGGAPPASFWLGSGHA